MATSVKSTMLLAGHRKYSYARGWRERSNIIGNITPITGTRRQDALSQSLLLRLNAAFRDEPRQDRLGEIPP